MFGMLLAASLVVAGATGVMAQEPAGTMRADTMHHAARRHMTTRHMRHTTRRMAATKHHARTRAERMRARESRETSRMEMRERMHERRMSMVSTRPSVLGREIGPSGVSSTGQLQRLPNGLITPDAARTIALRSVAGGSMVSKIDRGTSDGRQVYEVKVQTPGRAGNQKVTVDATTGQVLETKNVDNPIGGVTHTITSGVHKVTGH